MKQSIWRNKKGQIQGVDFALAMVIFMILFAEVIVLSLSYIEPKFQNLDDQAFQSQANQISEMFFGSTGYPSHWEYNLSSQFNSFGLREIGSTNLDANKLSRIHSRGLYALDYDNLKGNLSQERNFGFQLIIESLFDVNGTFTLAQPNSTIDISTTVRNCTVWSFLVGPFSTILYSNRSVTDNAGDFTTTFPMTAIPNGFYTLVIFAQSKEGYFAVDVKNGVFGTETYKRLKLLVQEQENNNGLAEINTENDGTLTTLTAVNVFPFKIGEESSGNETISITSPTTNEVLNLRMPTNGTCVTILTGLNGVNEYSRKYFVFPTQLSDKFGTKFGDDILPNNVEIFKTEKLVIIRQCIFKAVFYVWPE